MQLFRQSLTIALIVVIAGTTLGAQRPPAPGAAPAPAWLKPHPRLDALKKDVIAEVEKRRELTQQMVDSLFSFSELGFQEFETQRTTSSTCRASSESMSR